MTPTRSASNSSIKSHGSGPGNSSHKSKRQECKPRGGGQMEDSRTSTSSQRLARTFDTLIEHLEADINAIAVRPESLPTGRSRDIPVHHELISSSEEVHGVRKDRGPSEGLDTHVLQRTSPTDQSLVAKPNMLPEDQKKKLAQGKDNTPVEAPQASTSKNPPQTVPNKPKQTPKTN
ncbi:hypothetical protein O181_130799 [Austropuccinia psidii MF-1]|uniref:Uncharacterized protein n=1 Tax=Austropuccinia psidii MF-1 TaxID=1389203 RepID=A0A9Q3L4I6_9BASI|nr:hypothetical protein [Austropuccinia psidii MF-1]